MPLKLNSSGGGSVTLDTPSTASNRTLTLPDATTTVVGTDVAQTLSNKTFSGAQTFGTASFAEPSGSAPLYAARAWVNFNGTGTVAIRASGNVTSITDNGTGNYTVNFTTAMSDVNYATNGSAGTTVASNLIEIGTANTGNVQVFSKQGTTNIASDTANVNISIFR